MKKTIIRPADQKPVRVLDAAQLRSLVEAGKDDFFILLRFGLRSSKTVTLGRDGRTFDIVNEIDGTLQELSDEQLFDEQLTNIGKAMKAGAFFCMA